MTTEEKERLDRMEQHLRLIKEDLQYISSALVGSKVNGNKGVISDIDSIKHDIADLKEKLEVLSLERDEFKRKLEWSEGEFSSLLKA